MPPIKLLTFSSLYPSSVKPGHGIFVETRLRELVSSGRVQAQVIAPVPWFPSSNPWYGEYAKWATVPRHEVHNGLPVSHPRFVVVPKVGMALSPVALALAALRAARRLRSEGFDFDLIDAHYFYPDGVAAAAVARILKKPLIITARGSDINQIAGFALQRRMIRWAAEQASACIGVSQALVDAMAEIGMPGDRLHMLRNGVDLTRFVAHPKAQARSVIGHDGAPLLLSVGNLVPWKGHDLCIDALARLVPEFPAARLLIVGEGPARAELELHARNRGLQNRVHFVGSVPNVALAHWYSAADVLMLGSTREGWPNVLLESMACGTPAIATAVGGIPEIICSPQAGIVLSERTDVALAQAVRQLLALRPAPSLVRKHAERFSWADTSERLHSLLIDVLPTRARATCATSS